MWSDLTSGHIYPLQTGQLALEDGYVRLLQNCAAEYPCLRSHMSATTLHLASAYSNGMESWEPPLSGEITRTMWTLALLSCCPALPHGLRRPAACCKIPAFVGTRFKVGFSVFGYYMDNVQVRCR